MSTASREVELETAAAKPATAKALLEELCEVLCASSMEGVTALSRSRVVRIVTIVVSLAQFWRQRVHELSKD